MAKKKSGSVLYLDPRYTTERRLGYLLKRMTLEEKVRQMAFADCAQFARKGRFSTKLAKDFSRVSESEVCRPLA